jgi:pyruvate-formate lyase
LQLWFGFDVVYCILLSTGLIGHQQYENDKQMVFHFCCYLLNESVLDFEVNCCVMLNVPGKLRSDLLKNCDLYWLAEA